MAEQVTLLPEEIEKLKSFQSRFRFLSISYGETFFQRKLVDKELVEIDNQMDLLEDERMSYIQSIQEKYGVGTVNIETGVFVPESKEQVPPPNKSA